jgi:hypothetical protein
LPDIPSFLLADLMSNYGVPQAAVARNPAEVFQYFSQTAMATGSHTSFMSDADLAYFCRNNNINLAYNYQQQQQQSGNLMASSSQFLAKPSATNGPVVSPVGTKPTLPVSAGGVPLAVDDISSRVRSHLDSRLMTPSFKQRPAQTDQFTAGGAGEMQQQQASKRRLAPTQITTDKILPFANPDSAAHSVWKQQQTFTPNKSDVKGLTFYIIYCVVANHLSGQRSEHGFQRTPRAPRHSLEKQQIDFADLPADQQSSSGFTSYYFQTVSSADEQNPNSRCQSAASGGVKTLRAKIPPPPESSLEHRLSQRQKQIDIGKNTPEYFNYRKIVPK